MSSITSSPPRAPPIKYVAPLGTRWAKEKAAAGGAKAFDLPTDPKQIGPWILGECVGKGASGRVKIAKHMHTGQLAAVKILPVAPLVNSRASLATQQAKSDKQRLGIDREITMMKLMNHPNIMRLYDVYEGDKELFLVLEYVEGGELFDFLVNRGRLPPGEALSYFKQIIYGLNYAHTFSIIHRDLKPENILIASISPPLIKIADWGMAAFAPPSLQLETSCGSPHYASPEIVNGERYQGNATDIWSCGVILYALLTGRLPFDDKNVRTLLSKVKSGKYDMPTWIDPLAKDLLGRMLVVDVKKRISIPEILSHAWLSAVMTIGKPAPPQIEMPFLPPSPSTLARPIATPSLIDPELLSSLRVIWGRHTDPHGELLKRDLCSPAGRGVHAKAFYFLLRKYRDETLRNNASGNDETRETDENLATGSTKLDLGWELDLSRVTKRYEGTRSRGNTLTVIAQPTPHSRTPPPSSAPTSRAPPAMSRTGTSSSTQSSIRERPASPAGPRALQRHKTEQWRSQAQSSGHGMFNLSVPAPAPRPTSSLGIGRGGPRPLPPRRGYTLPNTTPDPHSMSGETKLSSARVSQAQLSVASQQQRALPSRAPSPVLPFTTADTSGPPSAITYAPIPLSLSAGVMDLNMDIGFEFDLSLLTSPKTRDPRQTADQIAENIDDSAANAVTGSIGSRLETGPEDNYVSTIEPGQNTTANRRARSSTTPCEQKSSTRGETRIPQTQRAAARASDANCDKENKSVGEDGWSYVSHEEIRNTGVGLGVGRDLRREIGNVVYPGEGVVGAKGKLKERKNRPLTLDPQKRSTALGSPITLSAPMNSSNPNRLMGSPVVGEFKGWFSNLFNWKSSQLNGYGIFYSHDDVSKTHKDVGRLLESLGIVVEGVGFSVTEGEGHVESAGALRCRVDELSIDAWSNLKPVKFRVEFSAVGLNQSAMSPKSNSSRLATPTQNSNSLHMSNPGVTHRTRASVLMSKGGSRAMATPGPNTASVGFPSRYVSAIMLVHEKGSMSTFRTIWRRLKDSYDDGSITGYPSLSPAMASTPTIEHRQRFVA